jgi:hypothetical protein
MTVLKLKQQKYKYIKLSLYRTWTGPEGSRSLRLQEFLDNLHINVVRSSALQTGCL